MVKVVASWSTDSAEAVAITGYRLATRLSGPSDSGEGGLVIELVLPTITNLYYFTAIGSITVHSTEKKNSLLDRVTSAPLHL